jgi:hypothetical protein
VITTVICVILIVLHVKAFTRLCHALQKEQFCYVYFIEQCSNYMRLIGNLFKADALASLSQAMESKWYESKI